MHSQRLRGGGGCGVARGWCAKGGGGKKNRSESPTFRHLRSRGPGARGACLRCRKSRALRTPRLMLPPREARCCWASSTTPTDARPLVFFFSSPSTTYRVGHNLHGGAPVNLGRAAFRPHGKCAASPRGAPPYAPSPCSIAEIPVGRAPLLHPETHPR